MSNRKKVILLASGILLLPGSAWAQYSPTATLDLGMGFGRMALGQAVLNSARAASGAGEKSPDTGSEQRATIERAEPDPAHAIPEGSLTFEAVPGVSDLVIRRFVDELSKDHPQLRAQVEEEFRSGALQDYFSELLDRYGYEADHLADVSAAYYLSLWKIAHGRELTPGQIAGVRRQMRALLAEEPDLMRLSDAQKQEISEIFALSASLSLQGYEQLVRSGDEETLANFRRGVQATYAPQGPDLTALSVTDDGFFIE
ncbi:DUF6683 family protein [Geminicoccus harenae]|nr:DUF6683 family protein [Geminicoccus harenae]